MSDRDVNRGGARNPFGRPSSDKETPGDVASEEVEAEVLDPELEADLGAEYGFRGDVLGEELKQARIEADKSLETAQRTQAEFENYRKRMGREQQDSIKRAGERIVLALLPIIDNLERAIDHAPADDGSELLDGVEMVLAQMLDVLAKEGAKQIDPFAEDFDALKHQAVGQAEDTDLPEGMVAEVFQKGYEMHGKVVRPAMVVVAVGGSAAEE